MTLIRSIPAPGTVIRVFLTDDHAVVRLGLKAILADDPRLEIVGEAGTGQECLRLIPTTQPHVVLLDLRLPDMPGLDVCRRLKGLANPPAVLVLTSFADDELVLEAISSGVDGYLLKDLEQTELPTAILSVASGHSILDPVVTGKVLGAARNKATDSFPKSTAGIGYSLTGQEQKLMSLLVVGKTNKEIADAMKLSDGTVRNYLSTIFTKLHVGNRTEAVALWLRRK